MRKTQPYANIARQGANCHGACRGRVRELDHTNANAPQKNTSTASDTAMRWAAAAPKMCSKPLNIKSNRTLLDCRTSVKPGACPRSINCASQALYRWQIGRASCRESV